MEFHAHRGSKRQIKEITTVTKKTRNVFVRHQDYFDMLDRFESPNYEEFNLYETPNPPAP